MEDLTRKSNGWGDVGTVTVSGLPRYRGTYYPEQPSQFSRGRTYSFFIQDDISVRSRLSLNLGLLFNRDEFIQELPGLVPPGSTTIVQTGTFLAFGFGDQIQPRLGVNYQLRKGQGDKVYANYGRYYGLDQKSSARGPGFGTAVHGECRLRHRHGRADLEDTSGQHGVQEYRPGDQAAVHGRVRPRVCLAPRRRLVG